MSLIQILFVIFSGATVSANAPVEMKLIKGGEFTPFFDKDKDGNSVSLLVKDFYLDEAPVTNNKFKEFLKKHPQWMRSKVKSIFADDAYLKHWNGDLEFPKEIALQPVRFVSWFAASEYCESLGKTLPTIVQWEYVAASDSVDKFASHKESYKKKVLKWYSKPSRDGFKDIKKGPKNFWGVYDMHGLLWEWNLDYNTALVTGESREDASLNKNKFCGSGSLGAKDKLDYGSFMRFGFRSSLKGNYAVGNLGFRCAKNLPFATGAK